MKEIRRGKLSDRQVVVRVIKEGRGGKWPWHKAGAKRGCPLYAMKDEEKLVSYVCYLSIARDEHNDERTDKKGKKRKREEKSWRKSRKDERKANDEKAAGKKS